MTCSQIPGKDFASPEKLSFSRVIFQMNIHMIVSRKKLRYAHIELYTKSKVKF